MTEPLPTKAEAMKAKPLSKESAAKMLRDFVEAWNKGDGNGHKLPWGNIFSAIETLEADFPPAITDAKRLADELLTEVEGRIATLEVKKDADNSNEISVMEALKHLRHVREALASASAPSTKQSTVQPSQRAEQTKR